MFSGKGRRPLPSRQPKTVHGVVEVLEERVVLSVSLSPVHLNLVIHGSPVPVGNGSHAIPLGGANPLFGGSPGPVGLDPGQLRTAFGLSSLMFGNVVGDGTGQTIAIADAYDDPSFVNTGTSGFASSDLAQFDQTFNLPDPPSFTKVNQDGNPGPLPGTDPAGAGNANGNWEIEEALDIEWAHALAPKASLVLVEASSDSDPNNYDLFHAVATAASLPGVSVVSMSWGLNEFNGVNPTPGNPAIPETAVDPTFTTPAGHQGVTFFAASGDSGSPGYYPAYSPNVVSVGGTTLNLNNDNTYNSEIAWSGSGGGTSQFESEPAFQQTVQSTGQRTIPDVAFDADPNSGVAIFDSYNNTDGSGPWLQIGGTSLASPSWAAIIAICNQGRVLGGGSTLDGPTQTLPYLYDLSASDYHDIVTGSNGGFKAGPGYDQVTGRGSPIPANLLTDLADYGTATQLGIAAQPPSNVIVNNSFGVVAVIEDNLGHIDPSYTGTVTLALANNPGNATLGGTLTVNAVKGRAVFSGLTLDQIADGYSFTITTAGLPTATTNSFNITADNTSGAGTFYPVATDADLRSVISQAEANSFANNTVVLATGTYVLTDTNAGQIVIQNTSGLSDKTLTIVGEGSANTVIDPGVPNWLDRLFEVVGATVLFQDLTISGGNARNGGILGGTVALGGGLLLDNASVTLTRVNVNGNVAAGAEGASGAGGATGAAGGNGGPATNAQGGGIYVSGGTLTLNNVTFESNVARGGVGGAGGAGGMGIHAGQPSAAQSGGAGGNGASGGTGAGGALYLASGQVIAINDTFTLNQALGGVGGAGGIGGNAGLDKVGGAGGNGGNAGPSAGGAIYLAQGTITLTGGSIDHNEASGGIGGAGGHGGAGGTAFGSSGGSILGGSGTGLSGGTTAHLPPNPVQPNGGLGGNGGSGAGGRGGGLYVAGGSLTITNALIQTNNASGGQGGQGGFGGGGGLGFGGATTPFGIGLSAGVGGSGGLGGNAGSGYAGGLYLTGGTLSIFNGALAGNIAQGGLGGSGGSGGAGALASGLFTGGGGGGGTPTVVPQSGGNGGDGGNGGAGWGGGSYVTGGTITLINETVADSSAKGGLGGLGGLGGPGQNTQAQGFSGSGGFSGNANAGALFLSGGNLDLDNGTVALNTLVVSGTGTATGDGVIQTGGALSATSSLFAGNGGADLIGDITADHSLFQSVPTTGTTITGSNNLTNVDPKLDPNGLQNNGGPTPTVGLLANSPALGGGANPLQLFTDQRGYAPRTGANGTDIGAFQSSGTADTTAPTATLQATNVTASNAASENPYQFTLTISDNVAVAASSLAGLVVQVVPPTAVGGPITATLVSTTAAGSTDPQGNAQSFILTFQITPPGGSWLGTDDGDYSVTLGGTPVTDLAGNAVGSGMVGTFNVAGGALEVTSFAATSTGIIAGFNEPFNLALLNLYDTAAAGFGPADLTLVGAATGPVQGSLIVTPGNQSITFVKTGGVLAPDTYTLTLRSAANGFTDTSGGLLDGNNSGVPGNNYTTTFTVAPSSSRVISIPDFARGPGQAVVVPAATGTGLPLTISDGTGVTSISLSITYDPSLLTITGVNLVANAPAGSSVSVNTSNPGVAVVTFTSPTALPAGLDTFADLVASVPDSAAYASKEVLVIGSLSVNGGAIAATDGDSVHVVAYLGDTTGNGGYSGLDATLIKRVVVGLDSGFAAFPLLDPTILGDIAGHGSLSAIDATYIKQVVVGISQPRIPSLPGVTITKGGPDPLIWLPQTLDASPGSTLTVPVMFLQTNGTAIGLDSANLAIEFDPSLFMVTGISLGGLTQGFTLTDSFDNATGEIIATEVSTSGAIVMSPGTEGTLLLVELAIRPGAGLGAARINLLGEGRVGSQVVYTSLNDGNLTLTPAPTDSDLDPTDGIVTVITPPPPKPARIWKGESPPTVGASIQSTSTVIPSPSMIATRVMPWIVASTGSGRVSPASPVIAAGPPAAIDFAIEAIHGATPSTSRPASIDDQDHSQSEPSDPTILIPWTPSDPSVNSPSTIDLTRKKSKDSRLIRMTTTPDAFGFRRSLL